MLIGMEDILETRLGGEKWTYGNRPAVYLIFGKDTQDGRMFARVVSFERMRRKRDSLLNAGIGVSTHKRTVRT